MADNELASRLQKRIEVEEGKGVEKKMLDYRDPQEEFAHPYPEFSEFSREQCAMFEDMFAEYDENKDDCICYDELKAMMVKRGQPLTHMELKKTISILDEDQDEKLNFREFMLMWSKCLKEEMPEGTGYTKIVATNEIVLAKPASAAGKETGVGGATTFFETKGKAGQDTQKFDDEIVDEQRKEYERKRQVKRDKEAAAAKKTAFAQRAGKFE